MQQTITSCFELYLARSDLRPSSIRFKRQALEHFTRWFGDMAVGQITPAIAEDYRTMLVKEGEASEQPTDIWQISNPSSTGYSVTGELHRVRSTPSGAIVSRSNTDKRLHPPNSGGS